MLCGADAAEAPGVVRIAVANVVRILGMFAERTREQHVPFGVELRCRQRMWRTPPLDPPWSKSLYMGEFPNLPPAHGPEPIDAHTEHSWAFWNKIERQEFSR